MHLRPILVTAIFAAAAGAALVRLTSGAAPTAFEVATPSPDVRGTSSRNHSVVRDAAGSARDENANAPSSEGDDSSADGSQAKPRARARAVVYVAGNVRHPGVYAIAENARVADALRAAGGTTAAADPVAVDLAARVEDGEEIAFPPLGAPDAASVPGQADTATAPRTHRRAKRKRRRKHAHSRPRAAAVDVNAADAESLATLPGIGPGLAQRIVAFRELNGPFASADELLDVGGVTANELDRLAPYLTFGDSRAPSTFARSTTSGE